jgi:hypothetical protein
MKYYIYEEATYEVEADRPKDALEKFLGNIRYPFGTEIHERNIYNEAQDDCTEEAES